jgi:hypothetical protein
MSLVPAPLLAPSSLGTRYHRLCVDPSLYLLDFRFYTIYPLVESSQIHLYFLIFGDDQVGYDLLKIPKFA